MIKKDYLENQSNIYQKIADAISNSIYILDIDERVVVWLNKKGQDELGYMTHPDDLHIVEDAISRAVHLKDEEFVTMEYRMKDTLGKFHWMRDQVTVFSRDAKGKVLSVLGVVTNIDDIKSSEQTLRSTVDKLNLSLSSVSMGTWEWDIEERELIWDDRMFELHDLKKTTEIDIVEELWKKSHRADMEAVHAKVIACIETQQNFNLSYRITHSNGEVHHIRLVGKHMHSHEGKRCFHGLAWDSTEVIQTQREINEAKGRLIASTKMAALGEMSGGIAHEINNPLTVIQARSFQLTQMVEQNNLNPEMIKQAAESISKTADKIAKIIRSLRTFAREGSNDPFEVVSLDSIIEETLSVCRTKFYNNGVTIIYDPTDPELEIECRVVQIEQVLLNLLNNSFDAIQELENKWIRISVLDVNCHVKIEITDSGDGISDDIIEQIMLPFFTTKDLGKGTGLGLSISQEIVRSHQGQLIYDSSKENTTFVVEFPKLQKDS